MASLLRPLYWTIWINRRRRAQKLLQFAEVEAEGGRDLVRASELTQDPVLRRLFLAHARDEERHAKMFRSRGLALGFGMSPRAGNALFDWISPGERGLEDVHISDERSLLAFIHLSESAAARDFAEYSRVLGHDPQTRSLFEHILRDEEHHMRYSLAQLHRISSGGSRLLLWKARLRRLWKAYLRLASAIAGVMSTVLLTIQYFILLPPFALLAKFALRRERPGWTALAPVADSNAGREF